MPYDQIVKIQRSIATNEPKPQVLIYNDDYSICVQFDLSRGFRKLFKENEYKIYCRAKLDKDGKLFIGDRVEDQGW